MLGSGIPLQTVHLSGVVPTRPLRIAVIVPSLRGGGLERVVRDLVLALDRDRFSPAVFAVGGLGIYAADLEQAGISVSDCSEPRVRVRGIPLRLIAQLARFRPDLIHAHSGTWYAAAVAKTVLRRPRLVFTDHGRYPPESRGRARVERWCARRTDRVVTVSQPLAEYVQEFLNLAASPLVIPNGIDLDGFTRSSPGSRERLRAEWGLAPEDVLAICVGRFVPVKNHRGLIAAFAAVAGSVPGLRLALLGTGPLEDEVRGQVRALGLEARVLFLGFRTDVADCLHAADVFTIPSTTEGLPLSLLEAMAAALPAIASEVGGIPDALGDPPCAIQVPPGDVAALAAALQRVATDPRLREQLRERGRQRALEFALPRIVECYSSLYSNSAESLQ